MDRLESSVFHGIFEEKMELGMLALLAFLPCKLRQFSCAGKPAGFMHCHAWWQRAAALKSQADRKSRQRRRMTVFPVSSEKSGSAMVQQLSIGIDALLSIAAGACQAMVCVANVPESVMNQAQAAIVFDKLPFAAL